VFFVRSKEEYSLMKRFRLVAKSPLDRLVAIFIAACSGKVAEAKQAFDVLDWTPDMIHGWSDEERAMGHFFANRLGSMCLGMASEENIMHALSAGRGRHGGARLWHMLAVYDHRSSVADRDFPGLPKLRTRAFAGCDGLEYVMWLLRAGPKPSKGDWVEVPIGSAPNCSDMMAS
jgi:hypothetical protein